jgi:hypothetical protein
MPRWKLVKWLENKQPQQEFQPRSSRPRGLKTRESSRRGDQIFVRWQQVIVYPQCGECCMTPCRFLEFWDDYYIFFKNLSKCALGLVFITALLPSNTSVSLLAFFITVDGKRFLPNPADGRTVVLRVNLWDILIENGVLRGVLHRLKYRFRDFPKM